MNKKYFITLLAAFLTFLCGRPAEQPDTVQSRPVTGIYALEYGRTKVLATYLSPLTYCGSSYAFTGSWSKAMPFNPSHAVMTFNGNFTFNDLLNPAQTARMIGLNGYIGWGMAWRTHFSPAVQFTLGGEIAASGGVYYLLRNGNNPVQALARASLGITASLSYHFNLGKLPILISDDVKLPSASIFFSQQYGESYYEIYLGNHKGLIHPGWWGNNFCINNLLNFTFDFGRTAASLGYRFDMQTQWANNLNTRIITHSLVIGVIPGGIGLKKSSRVLPESKIYSLY